LEGRLGSRVGVTREALLGLLAHVEAYIDFPDEDIDPDTGEAMAGKMLQLSGDMEALMATADQGRILREGVATVICGAPNVGKSSLLNVLLGFERAIVSDVAGTTRDTIEEVINLKGIPLRLIDTAGVRESDDVVELAGIARTSKQMEDADLILEVVDGSLPKAEPAYEVPGRNTAKHVLILNKADLRIHPSWAESTAVRMSCLQGDALLLADELFARVTGGAVAWSENLVAINARHRSCLLRAHEKLSAAANALRNGMSAEFVALDLRESMHAVGEIAGHADVEELLGQIFSSFCIGK
jgi:tRNA modification GTPase